MQDIFLGRQPIVDRNRDLVAFELLFRSASSGGAVFVDGMAASASVIVNTFGELGLQHVLGSRRGYINIDARFLMSDMLDFLPAEQVVLELLETIEFNDEVLAKCRDLKRKGFRLALDDVSAVQRDLSSILPMIDIVKIDLMATDSAVLPALVQSLQSRSVILLAEKVENESQAKSCIELGFDLFQGYFFARPEVLAGKRADPSKLALLRLLALVLGDAELNDLEQEFKRQPNLTFGLMRLLNSAAAGLSGRIGSVRQAIVAMGRRQLQRWLQLLLYTVDQPQSRMQGALIQMAATRGRLMELLAARERPGDSNYHSLAFMTGILSLLDVLLKMPLTEILAQLHLKEEVVAALLRRHGVLGNLLALVEKNEEQDVAAVTEILKGLPFLDMEHFVRADIEAAKWAALIGE